METQKSTNRNPRSTRAPRRRGIHGIRARSATAIGLSALLCGTLTQAPDLAMGASLGDHAASVAVTPGATPLTWSPCPFPGSPSTLECASIKVPVDYAHPEGRQTSVTIDRLKAAGGHRVGNLVFNPGGPGGSGTAIVYFESVGAHLFSRGVRR